MMFSKSPGFLEFEGEHIDSSEPMAKDTPWKMGLLQGSVKCQHNIRSHPRCCLALQEAQKGKAFGEICALITFQEQGRGCGDLSRRLSVAMVFRRNYFGRVDRAQ